MWKTKPPYEEAVKLVEPNATVPRNCPAISTPPEPSETAASAVTVFDDDAPVLLKPFTQVMLPEVLTFTTKVPRCLLSVRVVEPMVMLLSKVPTKKYPPAESKATALPVSFWLSPEAECPTLSAQSKAGVCAEQPASKSRPSSSAGDALLIIFSFSNTARVRGDAKVNESNQARENSNS